MKTPHLFPLLSFVIAFALLYLLPSSLFADGTLPLRASSDLTTWSALTNKPPFTVVQSATITAGTRRFLRLNVSQ